MYDDLMKTAQAIRPYNTHSHHRPADYFDGYDLVKLLYGSYVYWISPLPNLEALDDEWLRGIEHNAFFVWLEKGVRQVYGDDMRIDPAHKRELDARIRAAHAARDYDLAILNEHCAYEAIIQDSFWVPGDDNGHPELFKPTYRVNMYFYGYGSEPRDHNGNNPIALSGIEQPPTLDAYLAMTHDGIRSAKQRGAVAVKCALSYDRDYLLDDVGAVEAAQSYARLIAGSRDAADIKRFQDHLFYRIAAMCGEQRLPLQIHTGLSLLPNSRAIHLHALISANPNTTFVLFHGSYPYMQDIHALCHTHKNVYPDLVWLPQISPHAAARFVNEALDTGASGRMCWGCDTFNSEESVGSLLAARHVLCQALSERVAGGLMREEQAHACLTGILRDNAMRLYGR